jgi:hypothetical protein
MASAASASPSWVILGSVARVTAADADLPPGADLSLTLPAPPRVALLNIPPRAGTNLLYSHWGQVTPLIFGKTFNKSPYNTAQN